MINNAGDSSLLILHRNRVIFQFQCNHTLYMQNTGHISSVVDGLYLMR